MTDYEWVLSDAVCVRALDDDRVLVREADGPRAVLLELREDGEGELRLTFDGVFVDVGDDFLGFLGLMDEAQTAEGAELSVEAAES